MSSSIAPRVDFNFAHALAPFAHDEDLPLADVLTTADVERIFPQEQVCFGQTPGSFWTPAITLATMLRQMLCPDPSCRQAVANILLSLALCRDMDDELAHLDTSGYCRARAKIPALALKRLTLLV